MISKKIINGVEYYSANDIYREWAGDKYCRKQRSQFFINESTKALVHKFNVDIVNPCYFTGRGSGDLSGTWIIKELVPYYFNWLHKLPIRSYTRSEIQFCSIIKESFLDILEFEEQKVLGCYIVDMYCAKLNLCIEYDEKHHRYTKDYDEESTQDIKLNYGCEVIRHLESDSIGVTINRIFKLL